MIEMRLFLAGVAFFWTWSVSTAELPAAGPPTQQSANPPALIEQIRKPAESLTLWWVGNAGWLIQAEGLLIGIDLDLSHPNKLEKPPIEAEDLAAEIDWVLASHHHGDHCNRFTLETLARGGRAKFVLTPKCLAQLEEGAIPPDRLIIPTPGVPFSHPPLEVRPVHAIHGNQEFTVLTRESDFIESIANSCGYVFDLGGKRLFHPGDSVLTEEHLSLEGVDVLFVSPTIHNMYVDRSQILIEKLRPSFIFPQHFGTYRTTEENAFWTHGYPDELGARLSEELRRRYFKPSLGRRFVIE